MTMPDAPRLTSEDVADVDEQRVRELSAGVRLRPALDAPARWARLLYGITGWDLFNPDERGQQSASFPIGRSWSHGHVE
jgi:hypothetical protein